MYDFWEMGWDGWGIWEKVHQTYHKCFLSRDVSCSKLSGAPGWRKRHPRSLETCPLAGRHDVSFISVLHILSQHLPNAEKIMDWHRHNLSAGTILFNCIRTPTIHYLKWWTLCKVVYESTRLGCVVNEENQTVRFFCYLALYHKSLYVHYR